MKVDPRRLRPKSADDTMMLGVFVAAILLGLVVVFLVGHPLDVAP